MLAIVNNIRAPDGIMAFYPVTNLTKSVISSPSRVMFFHDVFVPIHFMFLCLQSYVPEGVDSSNFLISPAYAPDWVLHKLPKNLYLLSAAYDPLLDDATNLVRRLKNANIHSYHHQTYFLPHGFLNVANPVIPEAETAKRDSIIYLQKIFSL